jgi:hypothetical protein
MTDVAAETRLGTALTDRPDQPRNASTARSYRPVAPHLATSERLGPLADLPGFWEGTGFGLIARPDFDSDNPEGIFLQLNLLRETIEFRSIGSPVPNRGSAQPDIQLYGVTYLHRVTDAATGGALHIEPGIWLNVPATTEPKADAGIARLSTIPHGNAVCAVGFAQDLVPEGQPDIPPANTVPFDIGGQPPPARTQNPYAIYDLGVETPFRTNPLPVSVTQALIDDPNTMLRDALRGQVLEHITRLIVTSNPAGGVSNIPFISQNADAQNLESVFAIERVRVDDDSEILQLQYSQTALLGFRGKNFPHVTVGTLIKAF